MLRDMRRPPILIFVLRGGQWEPLSSDQLVPGDVVSLTSDATATKKAAQALLSKGMLSPLTSVGWCSVG